MNILIVDDSADKVIALRKSLKEAGIDDIYAVCYGNDAVEQILKEKYDLVIMDHNLPSYGMTSYDAVVAIKEINPNLVVVGFSKHWNESRVELAGLDGFALTVDQLLAFINGVAFINDFGGEEEQ